MITTDCVLYVHNYRSDLQRQRRGCECEGDKGKPFGCVISPLVSEWWGPNKRVTDTQCKMGWGWGEEPGRCVCVCVWGGGGGGVTERDHRKKRTRVRETLSS